MYPIRRKADILTVFKTFKAWVELESEKMIKCSRIDNRGEYTSDEFANFYQHESFKSQLTIAYTPQQNGVAERMNETLLEITRAMLKAIGLGKPLWVEAVKTACYVINRSLSSSIELKTLMEIWTRKVADYFWLHIFGSAVYVMYNTQ